MRKVRSTGPKSDPHFGLARAAGHGDRRAVSALMAEVLPSMLRVVRQILGVEHPDAEDVVQEAAFGLVEALSGFRGECTVRHFACRVALLTALNARRRFRLREQLTPHAAPAELDGMASEHSVGPDQLAERRRAVVLELLNELPQPQAEALAMHCVLGYTVAETAQATGVPQNTVRSRLGSAKASLRSVLREDVDLAEQLREWSRGAG